MYTGIALVLLGKGFWNQCWFRVKIYGKWAKDYMRRTFAFADIAPKVNRQSSADFVTSAYLQWLLSEKVGGSRQPPRLFFLSPMMPRPHEVISADGGWRVLFTYGAQRRPPPLSFFGSLGSHAVWPLCLRFARGFKCDCSVPSVGSDARTVFSMPGEISCGSINPDRRRFVGSTAEQKSDVWLMVNFDPEMRRYLDIEFTLP